MKVLFWGRILTRLYPGILMTRFLSAVCIAFFGLTLSASAQFDAGPLTGDQWVQPSNAGTVVGRIVVPTGGSMARAVADARVSISSIDGGGASGEAVTDAVGEFVIRGIHPGVYSLTAESSDAYAHLALHVIDSRADLGGRFHRIAEVSASDMSHAAVRSVVVRNRLLNRPQNVPHSITMADADYDGLEPQIVNATTYRVIQSEGGIIGRIYIAGARGPNLLPSSRTNVLIFKDGVEVGRAITNELGDFQINDIALGTYSLLAVAGHDFAAIGFELEAQGDGDAANRTTDGKQLVSAQTQKPANAFGLQIAPPGSVVGVMTQSIGYVPGGFYGGGGGGGGSGGLGGIAGLAGLAGIIGAIDNGNSFAPVPPIASPAVPGPVAN